ncbi:MAG: hypothetical protein Q8P18_01780 [Pseudomonadota bacterium]|nr:hypothetical protein [Pseudomonadota bacterium]
MRRARSALLTLVRLAVTSVALAVALLLGLNLFLNTGLLWLINRQPERLQMTWEHAWTWDARNLVVDGFTLRVQGPLDQWWLTVDHADLTVGLRALLERRFQADDVHAGGVVMRYRGRADAPTLPGKPPTPYVDGRTAPIPGLENPPLSRPEDLYPPPVAPWLVALDGVEVDDIREMWLGDYRFVGTAEASGELIVMPGASLDLSDISVEVLEGEIDVEGIPVISDFTLELLGALEGMDPVTDAGTGILRRLDATLRLGGQVDDLRYVDIFLRDAPWVGIEGGTGRLDALLDVQNGLLGPDSYARAVVTDLSARVGTYAAIGDGRIDITLDRLARLAVVLDTFSVHQGAGPPLVRGRGFRLDATTRALRLDEPPSGFTAVATLPRSEVPNLRSFDRYLPADIGLRITGGHALVAGQARVEEDGNQVSGMLTIEVPEARLAYAGIPIAGRAHVTGRVVSGLLDEGRYDVRGSSFAVDHVSIGGKNPNWSARLDVRRGRVATEDDTFLTTRSDFSCSDSSPFLRIAVGDRKVAPWIDELVLLRNLKGEVRASFGESRLAIDHLQIHTPKAELHLHMTQNGTRTDALLFARLGIFGAATRLAGDDYNVQLVNAKRWFYARLAEDGTPEPMTAQNGEVTSANDLVADDRKGLRLIGKELRKLYAKKDPAEKAANQAKREAAAAERAASLAAAQKERAARKEAAQK